MKRFSLILVIKISCFLVSCAEHASIEPAEAAIAHFNWGISFADQGDLGQAITEFQMAIKRDKRWAKPYYNLGIAYSQQQKWDDAIVAWKRTVYIDSTYANAYYNLARAYALKNREALSISLLTKAITLDEQLCKSIQTDRSFDRIRQNRAFQKFTDSIR